MHIFFCLLIYLRIFIDSNVSMKTHISKTVSSCFAALRRLRSIRRSVSQAVLLLLVLLRFSKSGKRTVSDGFVKKSADSVSDSWRIINLHTPAAVEHSACPLVGGKCGDDATRRRSFLAGKRQRNHRPTCRVPDTPYMHARTHVDVRRPTRHNASRRTRHTDARRCTMPKPHATHREVQYLSPVIPIVISITTYSTVHVKSSFLI